LAPLIKELLDSQRQSRGAAIKRNAIKPTSREGDPVAEQALSNLGWILMEAGDRAVGGNSGQFQAFAENNEPPDA
jgi:hypothetical protein